MTALSALALAWRESRFARRHLALLLAAIAVGVASVVAVGTFRMQLAAAVRDGARALMGADAVVSSREPFGPRTSAWIDSLQRSGAGVARTTSFASMALAPGSGRTRLARVRAVEPAFPFYGRVETDPAGAWGEVATGKNALVDPGLLISLGVRVGDSLALGRSRFRIAGVLDRLPGDLAFASAFAPRIVIPAAHLDETGLIGFGSRVEYEAALRLPRPGDAAALERTHARALRAERADLRTAQEQQAELAESLGRLGSYLALLGAMALILGGIGVASATAATMARKAESVAVLRCLGATSGQVVAVYLIQAVALGAAGAVVGVMLGLAAQGTLARLLADFLPVEVRPGLDPLAAATGIALGVWAAASFAWLPILATRAIPPLRALRRDVEPVRRGRDPRLWTARATTAGSALLLIALQAGRLKDGAVFGAGTAGALVLLAGFAALARCFLERLPPVSFSFATRQGLASLHRPRSRLLTVVPSIGLGVFVLTTLALVRHDLLAPIEPRSRETRANLVLWDVQEDQQRAVSGLLEERRLPLLQEAPIVPMRIASVERAKGGDAPRGDGRDPAEESGAPASDGRRGERRRTPAGWALRREYHSTFRDTLVASERVVEGRWWTPDSAASGRTAPGVASPGRTESRLQPFPVSMEEGVAHDLDIRVGDAITWDVQGVRIATRVRSLRSVEWARFEPNFFAVFPSRALEGAPRSWVLLTRAPTPEASAGLQLALVQRFPNVSLLDLRQIQAALEDVLGRIGAVIRFLAGFTLAAGLVVLLGTASASRLERMRETVLLKTLGATRRQLAQALMVEYAALGLAAAAGGIVLAIGAGWALARWFFEVPFSVPAAALAALAVLTTLISAAVGAGAALSAYRGTPMDGLREE